MATSLESVNGGDPGFLRQVFIPSIRSVLYVILMSSEGGFTLLALLRGLW